jgi:hypothetical protein
MKREVAGTLAILTALVGCRVHTQSATARPPVIPVTIGTVQGVIVPAARGGETFVSGHPKVSVR